MEPDDQLKRLLLVLPAIMVLVSIGIASILSIIFMRPEAKDNLLLIGQIVSILSPVLVGLLVLVKVERVEEKVDSQHRQVNSRMDELLRMTADEGYARGMAAREKK